MEISQSLDSSSHQVCQFCKLVVLVQRVYVISELCYVLRFDFHRGVIHIPVPDSVAFQGRIREPCFPFPLYTD